MSYQYHDVILLCLKDRSSRFPVRRRTGDRMAFRSFWNETFGTGTGRLRWQETWLDDSFCTAFLVRNNEGSGFTFSFFCTTDWLKAIEIVRTQAELLSLLKRGPRNESWKVLKSSPLLGMNLLSEITRRWCWLHSHSFIMFFCSNVDGGATASKNYGTDEDGMLDDGTTKTCLLSGMLVVPFMFLDACHCGCIPTRPLCFSFIHSNHSLQHNFIFLRQTLLATLDDNNRRRNARSRILCYESRASRSI